MYESLYRCIRRDIQSGKLTPGEKLPSKRTLAANLKVSKITVESAYNQLLAEGYIRAEEKVGYFVERVESTLPVPEPEREEQNPGEDWIDLTRQDSPFPFGAGSIARFFWIWDMICCSRCPIRDSRLCAGPSPGTLPSSGVCRCGRSRSSSARERTFFTIC